MNPGIIASFIPIISVIVTGIVLISYFYFRSKEKQIMIEKGLSFEQMIEILKSRKDNYALLKIGIIISFFGIGLGIGLLIERLANIDELIPFFIFFMLGLGFIVAHFASQKLTEKKENK
ncbi:MAG: hypothetical protein N2249_03665 [Melioribacter sp.]|nr:hypothetical protein [Melioribacter sp.]